MRVEAYRQHYHELFVPRRYDGARHVVATFGLGLLAAGILVYLIPEAFRPENLWVAPIAILIANLVEYVAHRGPMHNRAWPPVLFDRHAKRHHRYFTHDRMSISGPKDIHAVIFPAPMLLFFGSVAALLGCVVGVLFNFETGVVFAASTLAYYLAYELIHLICHLPEQSIARLPFPLRRLVNLHAIHHTPSLMRQSNFNVVFPLFDLLFGTLRTK